MSGTWASGWVTGDVVTAAEFKKGAGAILDSTAAGAQASWDSNTILGGVLPTGYAHLEIVLQARGDTAAATANMYLRFNNDSAGNYDWQRDYGTASSATAAEGFAAAQIDMGFFPAASATASTAGDCRIWVPNYNGTTFHKNATSSWGSTGGTGTGTLFSGNNSGKWRSTSAITRIQILPSAGNFAAGTRITVYAYGA